MKEQLELHRELREKQEKYAYYLIALCVTAIGFSVLQTTGKPIKSLQIPLGMSVLSWAISIYSGLQFIGKITTSIYRNSMFLDIVQGADPIVGRHPQGIQIAVDVYNKGSEKLSKASERLYSLQEVLFYFGILCFIVWHILEMYFTQVK